MSLTEVRSDPLTLITQDQMYLIWSPFDDYLAADELLKLLREDRIHDRSTREFSARSSSGLASPEGPEAA